MHIEKQKNKCRFIIEYDTLLFQILRKFKINLKVNSKDIRSPNNAFQRDIQS